MTKSITSRKHTKHYLQNAHANLCRRRDHAQDSNCSPLCISHDERIIITYVENAQAFHALEIICTFTASVQRFRICSAVFEIFRDATMTYNPGTSLRCMYRIQAGLSIGCKIVVQHTCLLNQ